MKKVKNTFCLYLCFDHVFGPCSTCNELHPVFSHVRSLGGASSVFLFVIKVK